MSNDKEQEQEKLDETIEEIDLHDKSEEEIERVVSALSAEGLALRKQRKKVRYQLYRLKSEAEGVCANVSEEGFKEKFEEQPLFNTWKNFSITWDVSMDDPYRIVRRHHSKLEEWEEVMAAKFPSLEQGGKITYPDINVRKKVEAEAKLQEENKKK